MKAILAAAAAVSVLAVAAPALAESNFSIGYSQNSIGNIDLGSVDARFGYRAWNWLGLEGELGLGVNDDTDSTPPPTKVELKTNMAAHVTGTLPVNETFNVFARVGYAKTEVESGGVDFDASGMSYGVGAEWFFSGDNGVRLDFTKRDYEDDFGDDADVWSLSYVRRFR